jgi:hypothetical protein
VPLLVLTGSLLATSGLKGQTRTPGLDEAAERVRQAWLAHDYAGLVASSDTLRLQLPGIGRATPVRPPQAARVLREYLRSANEIAFELRHFRSVAEGHSYAQMVRRYVVQGTSDERVETVFLGFRWLEGQWRLREVRVTP